MNFESIRSIIITSAKTLNLFLKLQNYFGLIKSLKGRKTSAFFVFCLCPFSCVNFNMFNKVLLWVFVLFIKSHFIT